MIYTALYGGSDTLKPLPLGMSGVVYTDDPGLRGQGWETRFEPMPHLGSPRLRAKFWKVFPDLAVPSEPVTVWLDASMQPTDAVVEMRSLIAGLDAVFFRHPERDCIYDEAAATQVVRPHIYAGQPLYGQCEHYRLRGHPDNWGLFASGAILRRNTEATRSLGQRWWREICRWSVQDQLSLPYIVRNSDEGPLPEGSRRLRWSTFGPGIWDNPWYTIQPHERDNP